MNISNDRLQKTTNVSSIEINRNIILKMLEISFVLFCIIIQETQLGMIPKEEFW